MSHIWNHDELYQAIVGLFNKEFIVGDIHLIPGAILCIMDKLRSIELHVKHGQIQIISQSEDQSYSCGASYDTLFKILLDYTNNFNSKMSLYICYDMPLGPFDYRELIQILIQNTLKCQISIPQHIPFSVENLSDIDNDYLARWGTYDSNKPIPDSIQYPHKRSTLIIMHYDARFILSTVLGG